MSLSFSFFFLFCGAKNLTQRSVHTCEYSTAELPSSALLFRCFLCCCFETEPCEAQACCWAFCVAEADLEFLILPSQSQRLRLVNYQSLTLMWELFLLTTEKALVISTALSCFQCENCLGPLLMCGAKHKLIADPTQPPFCPSAASIILIHFQPARTE